MANGVSGVYVALLSVQTETWTSRGSHRNYGTNFTKVYEFIIQIL